MPFPRQLQAKWLLRPNPVLCYTAAVFLAAAAQIARLPLNPPTLIPQITYIPFIVFGAAYGGLWPGLLTTGLCFLESMCFATEPIGTRTVGDPRHWLGLGVLLVAGLVICFSFERAKRAKLADTLTYELAALLNQTYDAVFVWELESKRITFWDQGALRLYGYSTCEALGQSAQELLATQFPESLAAWLAAIPLSSSWQGELVRTSRDGRRITVESRMSLRRSGEGEYRVIELARDISEQKRLEQSQARLACEVQMRQKTLESILQHSPACIAVLRDPDFTYETVNPAYQALFPGSPMVGRTLAQVWPEAAPLLLPLLNIVRDTQTVYHAIEAPIPKSRAPGGPLEQGYFNSSYVPFLGPGGEVHVLVAAVEVTRYKTAEEELRGANRELATIYASSPVALMVVDDDLCVRKLNDTAARFAGPKTSELVGLQLGEVLGCLSASGEARGCGHEPSCAQCPLQRAVLDTLWNGTPHQVEVWLSFFSEGRIDRRYLSVATTSMKNGEGMVLVSAHDITQRKRAEEGLHETVTQLQSALDQKTVLLKEIHHRVKNNLAVISSLLSMKADLVETAEARLALEESQSRVLSIALIHEQLYGSENLDRINFSHYTQQLVEQLKSVFVSEPERIAIRLNVAPIELGVHRAVPCALILHELVSNAFKHAFPSERCGEVHISLQESAPGYLELVIEDNGIGPHPGLVAPRAKSLGLRTVAILSRQLEGSFEQQTATGAGTRFVLRFPAGSSRRAACPSGNPA